MLAVCLYSLSGHHAWGRDAFDTDYVDCPASLRLPAVAALAVTYQDDADELRIAWRALGTEQVAALGDALRYRAQITAVVESRGHARRTRSVPLGADEVTIDELPLGTELAVSVALTGEAYVLSDIATATFGSLMAAPHFCAPFYSGQEPVPRVTGAAQPAAGHFYYLGFGPTFRKSVPAGDQAWFRVGLAHGAAVDLDRVDFAQYRLRVERADAGDVAGFDAATIAGTFVPHPQVADGLFAPGPHAYYDFPGSLFAEDGTYTLTAWAEDTAGMRISPERSETVHIASAATGASSFVTIDLWEGWTDDCGERQQEQAPRLSPCETGTALSAVQKQNYALIRDCNALLVAKAVLDPRGQVLDTWRANNPLYAWAGITVRALDGYGSNSERVVELRRTGKQLNGSIPPELGYLTQLVKLYLGHNQLSGSIPPELGYLTQLQNLWLNRNQLSGSIPPELGNLIQLEELILSDNPLSGSIPPELGDLPQLIALWLGDNQLSGSIPPELGNLIQLEDLVLADNQLSGSIPPELGNLAQLHELDLSHNQLSGSIPAELGDMPQLWELYLADNQLSGSIPAELGNLAQQLDYLYLADNQLSGCIPAALRVWAQAYSNSNDLNRLNLNYCP